MRSRLNYGWRSCRTRPTHSDRKDVLLNRRVFREFMKHAIQNGAHFTYIDEMSVSTRHLSFRSWTTKTARTSIKAPPASETISVIGAITEQGSLDCVLRKGTNKEEEVLEFLLDLDKAIQSRLDQGYKNHRKTNIWILDNAGYHKTSLIRKFAKKRGVMMVTLPQYTPEWNPIETVWAWVKRSLSKSPLRSR